MVGLTPILARARTPTVTGPSNCHTCTDCWHSETGFGHLTQLDQEGTKNGPVHTCGQGTGCPHAACTGLAINAQDSSQYLQILELADNAVDGDHAALLTLVRLNDRRVHFNAERGAIQVQGCEPGTMVANIPVQPVEVASLARAVGKPS